MKKEKTICKLEITEEYNNPKTLYSVHAKFPKRVHSYIGQGGGELSTAFNEAIKMLNKEHPKQNEDSGERIAGCKEIKKPPLGVIPSFIWREKRESELYQAIIRYDDEGLEHHKKWIRELCELHLLEDGLVSLLRNCVSETWGESFSKTQSQFDEFLKRKGLMETPKDINPEAIDVLNEMLQVRDIDLSAYLKIRNVIT